MNLTEARRQERISLAWALVSVVVAISCGWLLRNTQPAALVRVVLALLPVIPSALYILAVVRSIRSMDELQRRIQLEAVTFAFVGTLILSLMYGMLQKSGFFRAWAWDWEGIWLMMFGLWLVGYFAAVRRYQ